MIFSFKKSRNILYSITHFNLSIPSYLIYLLSFPKKFIHIFIGAHDTRKKKILCMCARIMHMWINTTNIR